MQNKEKAQQKFNINQNNIGIVYSATIVAYFLFTLIINMLVSFIPMSEFLKRFILSFCSIIALSVVIILFGVKAHGKWTDNLSIKKFKPIYLIYIIFVLLSMFFGLGLLNSFVAKIFHIESSPLVINSTLEYLAFIVSLCILPAIVEEIFFRGMLQKALQPFGVFFSIFITALLFSLYHFSITQLLYQFVFGVLFSGIYYLSKSVIPGIILHFLNNFLVLTLTFFKLEEVINSWLIQVGVIVAGCLMLSAFIVFGIIKVMKKREEHVIDKKARRDFFIYSLMGVLVSLVFIVVGVIPK